MKKIGEKIVNLNQRLLSAVYSGNLQGVIEAIENGANVHAEHDL